MMRCQPLHNSALTLVTTCKGRLHHLKQTIPQMVALNAHEVIVVDANCPDKTKDWVSNNWPQVTVISDPSGDKFNLSRARNIGAKFARTDWILFIDADIVLNDRFFSWVSQHNTNSLAAYYTAGNVDGTKNLNSWGTCIVPREAVKLVHGYDDAFRGWGGEDDDFYWKLERLGLEAKNFPGDSVEPIRHSDQERMQFATLKNKSVQTHINGTYIKLKRMILGFQSLSALELPRSVRGHLMDQVEKAHAHPYSGEISLHQLAVPITKKTHLDITHTISFKIKA